MSQPKYPVLSYMSKAGSPSDAFYEALQSFAEQLTAKFTAKVAGEPEDQLKSPIDQLFNAYGAVTKSKIVMKGESTLEGRIGRPDFAAHAEDLTIGYVELKAPGKGANPSTYSGHDKDQWLRFKNVPNLIYTDGNEWALYRNGELTAERIRFIGDVRTDGKKAINPENAQHLFALLVNFTDWAPIVPSNPKELAAFLAPFCRLIRAEVIDSLMDAESPMHSLKGDIQKLLFPDADDRQFSDAYAETVIFALLLAQMEGADVRNLREAYETLEKHHSLLSRSLEFLTDKEAQKEIRFSLEITQRIIHAIPPKVLQAKDATKDPWLFFYEDFLASYDPALRKKAGVYFTPLEIVRCQVRLIDEILQKHMEKKMGFVESGVATLDPATGTGTYLLAIVEHALARVEEEEGPGSVKGAAKALAERLYAFEWMVGPYAVAQLRFSQALSKHGASMPAKGPNIYLTNTLESPHTTPPAPPLFHKPMADEHLRALKVKESEHILVCLGNPPYGRHEATTKDNHAVTGGWVRYGDKESPDDLPILDDFIQPVKKAGHGGHLKNIYNLYVYFIRWSLWKVFEHKTAKGPGILTFITASSYLDGDAFIGIREHMRRVCDHIDIIDLGGEGRGTRKEENVFAIQTPVAIFIAWREGKSNQNTPAKVRYARLRGTRKNKLQMLDLVSSESDLHWQNVPGGWQDPFVPSTKTPFSSWPLLTDLFPWQHSGIQFKRAWPISPEKDLLKARWDALVQGKDKKNLFKETRDRKINKEYPDLMNSTSKLTPIISANSSDMIPPVRYGYRSFDRQWILPDNRACDYLRPALWQAHSHKQIYLSSMFNHQLGSGPAITTCAEIPDLHHFRGSFGAKEVLPLYRDANCNLPNILPGLIGMLSQAYSAPVAPDDLAGYVYCLLAQPEYTRRFAAELSRKEIRIPLTKNAGVFSAASLIGKHLIWLHTYGERLIDNDHPKGNIARGQARCVTAVPDTKDDYPNQYGYDATTLTLYVGNGAFRPVSSAIYEFEVSGLKVVESWLGYRMKKRRGKKSSALDDIRPVTWTAQFTTELLELLWVLEHTVAIHSDQSKLLDAVLQNDVFTADELPEVPEKYRDAPDKIKKEEQGSLL